MRTTRLLALSGLLALAATPLSSHAIGPETALDACIQNFVTTNFSKDQPVRVHKRSQATGPLDYYARKKYMIEITARSKSGEKISKAKCVASPQGYVILLDTKPAETMNAG